MIILRLQKKNWCTLLDFLAKEWTHCNPKSLQKQLLPQESSESVARRGVNQSDGEIEGNGFDNVPILATSTLVWSYCIREKHTAKKSWHECAFDGRCLPVVWFDASVNSDVHWDQV